MKEKIVCNDTILDDDISSFAPAFSNLLFFSEIESCRPEMKKIRNIFLLLSLVAPTVRTRKCKTLVCISLPSPPYRHTCSHRYQLLLTILMIRRLKRSDERIQAVQPRDRQFS